MHSADIFQTIRHQMKYGYLHNTSPLLLLQNNYFWEHSWMAASYGQLRRFLCFKSLHGYAFFVYYVCKFLNSLIFWKIHITFILMKLHHYDPTKTRFSVFWGYPETLTHFSAMSHFCAPWKRPKTKGFLTFSGDIEIWH